uniref:Putative secreted protein n=1 Tax=Anopheles darlingi TaxID=43151 RepID=A0A2M4DJ35_ANODA
MRRPMVAVLLGQGPRAVAGGAPPSAPVSPALRSPPSCASFEAEIGIARMAGWPGFRNGKGKPSHFSGVLSCAILPGGGGKIAASFLLVIDSRFHLRGVARKGQRSAQHLPPITCCEISAHSVQVVAGCFRRQPIERIGPPHTR